MEAILPTLETAVSDGSAFVQTYPEQFLLGAIVLLMAYFCAGIMRPDRQTWFDRHLLRAAAKYGGRVPGDVMVKLHRKAELIAARQRTKENRAAIAAASAAAPAVQVLNPAPVPEPAPVLVEREAPQAITPAPPANIFADSASEPEITPVPIDDDSRTDDDFFEDEPLETAPIDDETPVLTAESGDASAEAEGDSLETPDEPVEPPPAPLAAGAPPEESIDEEPAPIPEPTPTNDRPDDDEVVTH